MADADALKCPSCGFPADPVDLASQGLGARCRICGAKMQVPADGGVAAAAPGDSLADAPLTADARTNAAPRDSLAGAVLTADGTLAPGARAMVALPARFTVSTDGGELHVQRAWYGLKAYLLAVFCVPWFGFLAVWYTLAWSSGNRIAMLMPLLHVAAGLALVYIAAAHFVNRTHVDVADGHLAIRHEPMPWPGALRLESGTLDQLFTQQDVNRGRNSTTITYSLHARCTDGRTVRLLSGLDQHEQALFIEQQVERHLRIADRPMTGEWAR
jgi:hypothetical protein